MDEKQIAERMSRIFAEEMMQPETWWLVSFLGEKNKPLGCCFVQGHGTLTAIRRTHDLGINPGGSVHTRRLNAVIETPESYRNRLLQAEDLDALAALYEASQPAPEPTNRAGRRLRRIKVGEA